MIVVQLNAEKIAATTSLVRRFARSWTSIGIGNARIMTSSAVLMIAMARRIGRALMQCPGTSGSQSLWTGWQANKMAQKVDMMNPQVRAIPIQTQMWKFLDGFIRR